MRQCSVVSRLKIEEGDIGDYKKLSAFHYRENRVGPFEKIFVIRPTQAGRIFVADAVGVIVYGMPTAGLQLRNIAMGNVFDGLDGPTRLSLINKNIRTISRVIIEPRFRGLGLSSWLVKETLGQVCVPIVEALAVMGAVNGFFLRAGMIAYTANYSTKSLQMADALGTVGIREDELIDPQLVEEKLGRLLMAERDFIDRQMEIFLQSYGERRLMRAGLERTRFILSKLSHRPVYYIWFNPKMKNMIG
jgi:GNAT superfamily N-acetyltransferase